MSVIIHAQSSFIKQSNQQTEGGKKPSLGLTHNLVFEHSRVANKLHALIHELSEIS